MKIIEENRNELPLAFLLAEKKAEKPKGKVSVSKSLNSSDYQDSNYIVERVEKHILRF